MNVDDLNHREFLEFGQEDGVIRFAGQRAILLDAEALGALRKHLIADSGPTVARSVLTQFGFAHGWRMGEALRAEVPSASRDELCRAASRVFSMEGLFCPQDGQGDPLEDAGTTLLDTYEAEQHLQHFGPSPDCVCWTICGLMSGYVSSITGEDYFVIEERCVGAGHAACTFIARTREAWGATRAEALGFFAHGHMKNLVSPKRRETTRPGDANGRSPRKAAASGADAKRDHHGVVARSESMRLIVDLVRRVAVVDATVLVTGETGTGKERIARLIHDESNRAGQPFVAVNCGAISESLLESELFGHARGAFTGANTHRAGLFEAAHHGTILLDEIGEISPGVQVKLLRVLQEREVRRVGENESRAVDVRVVAATNRDLAQDVANGTFRQDLFYRLKVVDLNMPPLRRRRDDILPLARLLLSEAAASMGRKLTGLSPAAAEQLLRYGWPGNVRELENTMHRATALARGTRVELDDLPDEIRHTFARPVPTRDTVQTLDEVEKDYILATLALNRGNQTQTAEQLQIGSATLYRKLKLYGVQGGRAAATPSPWEAADAVRPPARAGRPGQRSERAGIVWSGSARRLGATSSEASSPSSLT